MKLYKLYTFSAILFISSIIVGQDLSKVVVVESAYKPEIENSEKYGSMPALIDTAKTNINIEYSVLPSRLQTSYNIKPIKPAKLVGSPLDELYKSQVRLGLGNYTTPLAEFSIHNLRSKDYAVGAYVFHRSSHAKLELEDGSKVPAGYGKNQANAYGKRFYKGVNAEAEVYFNSDKYRFYGYNTQRVTDTTLDVGDIKQFYTKFGARTSVYSTKADSSAFSYRFGLEAFYFGDAYKYRENVLNIPARLSFNISDFRLDAGIGYTGYFQKYDTLNTEHVINVHPLLRKRKDDWEIAVGGNFFYAEDKAFFFPEAQLMFTVVDKVLEAFVGINGNLKINSYEKLSLENPYIKPGLQTGNTNTKLNGFGGLQGLITRNSGYKANVSFKSIENAIFFINDTVGEMGNQFISVSDNMEVFSLKGELWFKPLSFLDFYLQGNYNNHNTASELKAWHLPVYTLNFTTSFNFKEKIFVNLDLLNIGTRYAYNFEHPNMPHLLDPIWDINLKLEYKYSEVLSGFIDVYNILSKQYYLWNQYPTQKLNVLIGFSYKF
ncbi:MAG: hypothetical protein JXA77_14745 [Bacteroidales bacterium]|nr:hypothetical protein [Bacteroidales bacterium]MBN2818649.1 hypothetical protein [Bacteroidales bacterium]